MKKYFFIIIGGLIVFPLILDWGVIGNSFPSNIDNNSWVCFWGSYLGGTISAIITLGGIYWQVTRDEKQKSKKDKVGLLKGIATFIKDNLENKDNAYVIFDILDYKMAAIHSEEFDNTICEIPKELISENYKILFEFNDNLGKNIIDLNKKMLIFNNHYSFLSRNNRKILGIIDKIKIKLIEKEKKDSLTVITKNIELYKVGKSDEKKLVTKLSEIDTEKTLKEEIINFAKEYKENKKNYTEYLAYISFLEDYFAFNNSKKFTWEEINNGIDDRIKKGIECHILISNYKGAREEELKDKIRLSFEDITKSNEDLLVALENSEIRGVSKECEIFEKILTTENILLKSEIDIFKISEDMKQVCDKIELELKSCE